MDLKRIRERRKGKASEDDQRPMVETNTNENNTPNKRPTSANLPGNVADDLKRIRERRTQKAYKGDQHQIVEATNNDDITPTNQPASAGLPSNVAADLQRIRARRTRKATRVENERPRPRAKNTTIHNNVRQRQAGTMFFKSDTHTEGQSKGWLE